jgi:phosphoglycolate phosphatase
MKTTILLDLDGTLIDPWPGISRCIEYALLHMGLPAPSQDVLRTWIGPPLKQSFLRLFTELGTGDADHAMSLYRKRFSSKGLFENCVYDGIPEMLDEFSAAGYRLLLATSKPVVYARRICAHFGLDQFLSAIYGSELDGRRTDKIELLAHIIGQEQLNPTHCMMLGDREYDMRGARYHGIKAVGVLWGFGSSAELHEAGAQWLISTPGELTAVLRTSSAMADK